MADFVSLANINVDDQIVREAVSQVDPPLLAAVALACGDRGLLLPELRPDLSDPFDPGGGWTAEQRESAREKVFRALIALRDGHDRVDQPGPSDLQPVLEFLTGQAVDSTLLRFMREELEVEGDDLRAPDWHKDQLDPDRPFMVAVIGAGMSGLLAAYRLQQTGVPYVVLEKNSEVGGTWLENSYPGCRVDVANHFFSYSFAQRHDWPQLFSTQDVLLDYFKDFADREGLRPHIRFSTEVESARWCEKTASWALRLRTEHGRESMEAQALVVAVGQLNRPKLPDIEGFDSFAGSWWHSARWDHSVDLRGKRVAVIGNGCSAAQLIPIVADEAERVEIFQRTPNWFVPTPDYHDEVPEWQRWLFCHVPFYSQCYRFWLFWRGAEALLPAAKVDVDFKPGAPSTGAMNEVLRSALAGYIETEFADRPDLLSKVLPSYPPASKRMLRDNGIWARTLNRDNVTLVTDRIERVAPEGIITDGGVLHDADIIVYATGFQASRFLTPMQVIGRDDRDLHAGWAGDARAYLGITVPGFPNLFCLYGPNTNIVVNGSIIFFSECEVRYLMGCLRLLFERDAAALDVRQEVHDEFNVRVDEANRQSVWGVATVNSWYRNEKGRVSQNWPFTLLNYWAATLAPNPDDFEFLRTSTHSPA